MMIRRSVATAACVGIAMCLARAASASPVCVVPTSTSLNLIPVGCDAVLTNGPVTYTHVLDGSGTLFDISVTGILLSNFNMGASTATAEFIGTAHNLTSGTTSSFDITTTDNLETSPHDNSFAADTGTHFFDMAHFINGLGPGAGLKLNFGEAGKPPQTSHAFGGADTTTNPGFFTVSSTFQLYTEFSLDGAAHWTLADNDFLSTGANGPGSILQLQNIRAVPEPGTLTLAALGLTVAARRFRRRS